MEFKLITPPDAALFHAIRLRSLREHPEAFSASHEEESERTMEQVARQLESALPDTMHFGAWEAGNLVGILSLFRYARAKTRHKAILGGMYVVPERRNHGVGRALLAYVLDYARALDGLEDLTLAVTAGNEAARNLYLEAGFVPYGVEPHYIRVDTQYYGIEWMHRPVALEDSAQTRERRGPETDGGHP